MYELDGYHSRFFPLTRFEILDRATGRRDPIYAPADWVDRLSDRDMIWIVDPRRDYRVQIRFDVFPLLRNVAAHRDGLVANIVEDLEALAPLRPRLVSHDGDTALIEAVMNDTGDGEHIFRLFRLWPDDDVFFVGELSLGIPPELLDQPETLDLIELFRAQLMRAEPADDLPLVDRLPPPRADDRFNFRDLTEVEPHGFMQLRIPSCWSAEHHDDGMLCYFDPDENLATLYVNYQVVIRFPGHGGWLERKVDLTRREETDPDGPLIRFKWMISDTTHDRALLALVDLVIDAAQADKPEFRELVAIINDEVRRMRIAMPPASAEACAQPARGERRGANT